MNVYEYSLLRLKYDNRPSWAQFLGIYSILLNNEIVESEYPRLFYKRKLGSHVIHQYLPEKIRVKEESKFSNLYKDLCKKS
jgi:endo-1,4-beta-mannosidase